jgi:hypothetical protein
MTQIATTTKPAPPATPQPSKEEVRQKVLADQAAALKDAATRQLAKATDKAKPTKTAAPTKKVKEKKADTRKITVLAKTNPHAAGSRRASWFKQLKNGMTVDEAVAAGVRGIYLQRMAARKVIKLA